MLEALENVPAFTRQEIDDKLGLKLQTVCGRVRELCDAFLNECSALAMEERLIRTGRDTSERSLAQLQEP